jgi:hypothetical protein
MCTDHQAYGVGGINVSLEKTKVDRTFKIPALIYCPSLFKPEKAKFLRLSLILFLQLLIFLI